MVQHTATSVVTIERFIIEQERQHPEATGELSGILYDMALAAKMIANKVRRAGLADILGATGTRTCRARVAEARRARQRHDHQRAGRTAASCARWPARKSRDIIPIPDGYPARQVRADVRPARRLVATSTSTSASGPSSRIHERITRGASGPSSEDLLQAGRKQVAAGYVIYGSSTMLVYTTGAGRPRLHARPVGRRVLPLAPEHPHPRARPDLLGQRGQLRAAWDEARRKWVDWLKTPGRRRATSVQRALRGLAGRRLPPHPARGRRVRATPANKKNAERQAAPDVRGRAAGVHRRAGRRRRLRRARERILDIVPTSCTSACRSSSAARATWISRPRPTRTIRSW